MTLEPHAVDTADARTVHLHRRLGDEIQRVGELNGDAVLRPRGALATRQRQRVHAVEATTRRAQRQHDHPDRSLQRRGPRHFAAPGRMPPSVGSEPSGNGTSLSSDKYSRHCLGGPPTDVKNWQMNSAGLSLTLLPTKREL